MVKRGRGGVLIVGSEAALGGQGRLSMFTANKGYAINVGESPWQEWQSHGVDVLNAIMGPARRCVVRWRRTVRNAWCPAATF